MGKASHHYIPALKYDCLSSLYDPVIRLTLREATFKRHLVNQARIEPGQRVLDLGCGTATLTLLVKRLHPEAEVAGVDGDPKILKIARAKAAREGLSVKLDRAMAFALPYPAESFDRVLSSLVFHHLTRENKTRALSEVWRVLRPGGELHIADWGRPQNAALWLAFSLVRWFDSLETTEDNVKGRLPELMGAAGFVAVETTAHYATLFGTLSLYQARKPQK